MIAAPVQRHCRPVQRHKVPAEITVSRGKPVVGKNKTAAPTVQRRSFIIIITRLSAKDTNGVMKIPDGLSLLSVSCYSFPAILAYYTARGGE